MFHVRVPPFVGRSLAIDIRQRCDQAVGSQSERLAQARVISDWWEWEWDGGGGRRQEGTDDGGRGGVANRAGRTLAPAAACEEISQQDLDACITWREGKRNGVTRR